MNWLIPTAYPVPVATEVRQMFLNERTPGRPRGRRPRVRTRPEVAPVVCQCAHCGMNFIRKTNAARYCCITCRNRVHYLKKLAAARRKTAEKPKSFFRECVICGGSFEARRKSAACCSARCRKVKADRAHARA